MENFEVIGCSDLHVPADAVLKPVNGTFRSFVSRKMLANIGREWMTLVSDVKLEECDSSGIRRHVVKTGSKIRLIKYGNATVAARVAVIPPEE
jgi:hypothetical protein